MSPILTFFASITSTTSSAPAAAAISTVRVFFFLLDFLLAVFTHRLLDTCRHADKKAMDVESSATTRADKAAACVVRLSARFHKRRCCEHLSTPGALLRRPDCCQRVRLRPASFVDLLCACGVGAFWLRRNVVGFSCCWPNEPVRCNLCFALDNRSVSRGCGRRAFAGAHHRRGSRLSRLRRCPSGCHFWLGDSAIFFAFSLLSREVLKQHSTTQQRPRPNR